MKTWAVDADETIAVERIAQCFLQATGVDWLVCAGSEFNVLVDHRQHECVEVEFQLIHRDRGAKGEVAASAIADAINLIRAVVAFRVHIADPKVRHLLAMVDSVQFIVHGYQPFIP